MSEAPLAGDLMIRPNGALMFGVFRLGADRFEHPVREFGLYAEALLHARHLAEASAVDVWEARGHYVHSTRVVRCRGGMSPLSTTQPGERKVDRAKSDASRQSGEH